MAIVYPLVPPASPTTSDLKLMQNNIVGESVSPFTGSQQIFENPGEWWEAELAVPPMSSRADAEQWKTFLTALRGKSGSFLLGDPGAVTPQGSLGAYSDLLRYTEQFDNAVWVPSRIGASPSLPTVTANAVNDPNSNLTADALNFSTSSGGDFGYIYQVASPIPTRGRTFTFSVYLKVASGTAVVQLQVSDLIVVGLLASVTVTTSWQRFTVTGTFPQDWKNIQQVAGLIAFGNGVGSGGSAKTVYAWGAQLDRGSAALAYSGINIDQGERVNGAGQTGKTLVCVTALGNSTIFKAGDYVQLGTGTLQRLYKVLTDATTDNTGNVTLDIFPRLRESPANTTPIYWQECRGIFRLKDNLRSWQLDNALLYQGMRLQCKEAF